MIDLVFKYIMPIISFAMGIFVLIRVRQLIDRDTVRLFKQVKSWWGTSQGARGNTSQANTKAYNSGKKKIGSWIKSKTFGALDEMTDEEVHAYILHEDTVNFVIKLKELGIDVAAFLREGGFKLPGMPQLPQPRTRDQDEVPTM